MGEEREFGAVGSRLLAVTAGEQAELHSAVDIGEEAASVLEIEEAGQQFRLRDILEEVLGRVVGRDPGGEHASRAAALVEHVPHRLGENCIGVDVASRAQGEAAGVAQQVAPAVGLAESFEVCLVKFGIVVLQRPDHPFAGGRVGGVRDLGTSLGEPFLLLELYSLPGGVPEDAVEAAFVEDFGEGEVPVEELVVAGELFDFVALFGGQGLGVGLESSQGVGGDALGGVGGRPASAGRRRRTRRRRFACPGGREGRRPGPGTVLPCASLRPGCRPEFARSSGCAMRVIRTPPGARRPSGTSCRVVGSRVPVCSFS